MYSEPEISMAAIVTTDKCSAACAECCFQCSPKNKNMLTYDQIVSFVDEITEIKDSVSVLVFTGWEATLLGNVLFKGIKYASEKGLSTRLVTNAWWAKMEKPAERMINLLMENGLKEINYSTGQNHQEWVNLDCVINACYASTLNGLQTAVSIEAFDGTNFTMNDFYNHSRIVDLLTLLPNKSLLSVMESPWVSLTRKRNFYHESINISDSQQGCDSILTYIGLDELGEIISCCGLTQKSITEMNLSKLYPNSSIKEMLEQQSLDVLKIWIWLDGPQTIYNTILAENNEIVRDERLVHSCEFCAAIYLNDQIKLALYQYLTPERVTEIVNRYQIKKYMFDKKRPLEVSK